MTRKKEVRETSIQKRDNYIHIETAGCIVNIRPGLENMDGHKVTSIEILPDHYGEGDTWRVEPEYHNIRVIKVTEG